MKYGKWRQETNQVSWLCKECQSDETDQLTPEGKQWKHDLPTSEENLFSVGMLCVPYLVVHPEANDLGQEGPCKASSDQLFVGPTQGRLIQTLPYDATCKLIHLKTQLGLPVSVWVHLENENECALIFLKCMSFRRTLSICTWFWMWKWLEGLTYQALVVVTEAREQLVGGVEEGLTHQLKPLPARPSPVQSYREMSKCLAVWPP